MQAAPHPRGVIDFRPPAAAQARIAERIALQRADQISIEEATELAEFLLIEHIMMMAKAQARQRLHLAGQHRLTK